MFKNFIRNLKLGVDKPPIVWYNNSRKRGNKNVKEKRQKRKKDDPPTVTRTLTYEVEGLCPKEWQGLQPQTKTQRKGQ